MTTEEQTTVTRVDTEDGGRYVLSIAGDEAGHAHFTRDEEGRLRFDHTEVDDRFEGRGFGSLLVDDALSDVARQGEIVIPVCPFVVDFLKDNDVAGLQVDWPDDDDAQDSATPGEQPG